MRAPEGKRITCENALISGGEKREGVHGATEGARGVAGGASASGSEVRTCGGNPCGPATLGEASPVSQGEGNEAAGPDKYLRFARTAGRDHRDQRRGFLPTMEQSRKRRLRKCAAERTSRARRYAWFDRGKAQRSPTHHLLGTRCRSLFHICHVPR